MKKLYFFLVPIVFLFSGSTAYSQWTEQTSSTAKKQNAVFFLNQLTGFTGGDTGTIQRSTNAGATWFSSNLGISGNVNVTDIFFSGSDTGYCTVSNGSLTGKIHRTSNGGAVWTIMFDTTNIGLRGIFFANVNTGWAVGNGGTVKYTTNTGMNWLSRNFMGTTNTCVYALSASLVMVGGFGSAGYIARSTNAGVNWSFQSIPANIADIRFIYFADANTGYSGGLALGGQGGMCKSTDGGLTWSLLAGYVGSTPLNAYFINASTGYVVNSSSELKITTDGGISWLNQSVPTNGSYADIHGSGSFACIAGKKIATNTTVSIQQISNELPSEFSLEQNYPNPFNPMTSIGLRIADFGFVSLKVFDVTGREVAVLVNEDLNAGTYKIYFDASNLATGVYFYRMQTKDFTQTKKMLLIK